MALPKFLKALFQILQNEDARIIGWSHGGKAFQIRDVNKLQKVVLPKYFKHNKLASFQRQLNYFGFRKWTKTQTQVCTFSHPHFIEGERDALTLITKKSSTTTLGKRLASNQEQEPTTVSKCAKQHHLSEDFWTSPEFALMDPIPVTIEELEDVFLNEPEVEPFEDQGFDLCMTVDMAFIDILLS